MRGAGTVMTLLALGGPILPLPAEEARPRSSPPPEPRLPAAVAVAADVAVERSLLVVDLERYRDLARRRAASQARLSDLYRALDAAVAAEDAATREQAQSFLDQVDAIESERVRLLAAERVVIERIVGRSRRIGLLEQEVARLEGQREEASGVLNGSWDVVLLPFDQHGVFRLQQSGTLVTGTYELDGGWNGSLQGTLVNRKVYLVRVDSRLGRSMEFEGYLSGDGGTIRGNWLNYELAGDEGGTGQWAATRR